MYPKKKEKKEGKKDRFNFDSLSPTKLDKKWNWYNTYYMLSGKLNMSVIEVSKLKWIKTLEWMTYFEELKRVTDNINKNKK